MSKKWLFLLTITFIVSTNTQQTNYARGRALQGRGSNTGRPTATSNHNESGSVADSMAPSSIISRVASFPLSVVKSVLDRLTEVFSGLLSSLISQTWIVMKNYVIPNADKMLMEVSSVSAFPENLRDLISQAHSAYQFAKMFGYLKPA